MDAAAVQIDQWSDDASFIFCRLIHMEGDGFLSDILLNGVANEVDGDLAGFDDLDIPMTQETQHGDVEVQASRSTKGSKRTQETQRGASKMDGRAARSPSREMKGRRPSTDPAKN